jgi:hypothetical protein
MTSFGENIRGTIPTLKKEKHIELRLNLGRKFAH